MKINRRQVVETITNEIMKSISLQIREIIREEYALEGKKIRKQLLEEFGSNDRRPQQSTQQQFLPPMQRKTKIDTGDRVLNSILDEIKIDEEVDQPINFTSKTNIQAITEEIKKPKSQTSLYQPQPGEGYNFDPRTMDPSQIDWTTMVDKLEERNNPLPS
jgi:hypothetical protein